MEHELKLQKNEHVYYHLLFTINLHIQILPANLINVVLLI